MDRLASLSTHLRPSPRMPVLFVGHGNPMNAITDNEFTRSWKKIGKNLPQAQAIVVISAHWLTRGTHITNAPTQPIIYDMYGFPNELYEVEYPAKGDPKLAEVLKRQFLEYEAILDSSWGLDHGTWSVLKHLRPVANVPVLQISLDANQSLPQVVEMFSNLRPLRDKGVIFIGSGNIVHNLGMVRFDSPTAYDWALEFDELSKIAIQEKNIAGLTVPVTLGGAARPSIPTDDHYRPMLAAMSLLDPDEQLDFFNEKIDLGSVSMRSFITT